MTHAAPSEEPQLLVSCAEGPPDWRALFGHDNPLAVEVGVGKGVFLARLAKTSPGVNVVGIEIRAKRIEKIVKRIRAEKLANVRILQGDARAIFERAFANDSVAAVYLNFPDPWPKRRHAKRRIFRGEFPACVHRVLIPGGRWYACTDVLAYTREMIGSVDALGIFVNEGDATGFSERPAGYPASIHEEKFRAWGRRIHYMRWKKRDR